MNYSNILKKCLDELSKESPKLDYLRGMLEVLNEMSDKPLSITNVQYVEKPLPILSRPATPGLNMTGSGLVDDGEINEVLEKYVGGNTAQLS